MAREAYDFPEIDLSKSIMVGNNMSNQFSRNAVCYDFVQTTDPDQPIPHPAIDLAFTDLAGFAKALQNT
jgi:D-glycero-D-manno-heptose 1,7-bisphosphate phosphatase/D-glycero-alpha-D-manno-heptose 1-phosphate guanylyltransferase